MSESAPSPPGRVFISYRREDTAYAAGWLFDRLAERYGRDHIFKDVDSIRLGDDFVDVLNHAVGSCDVLIALIGTHWLTAVDKRGQPRLNDPKDFVRLEIEAALARNVRVIPVLVDGARMPPADVLPPSLTALSRRHALELSPERFDFDTSRLLRVLGGAVAPPAPQEATAHDEVKSRRGPASLRALYVEARAETRLGHFQTAIELLDELLAVDPDHRDAAELRTTVSQQLSLGAAYQRGVDAEAAGEWAAAVQAYTDVVEIDPSYRDAAARCAACEKQHRVHDLQSELRHHAAAERWQAVLDVDAELSTLDPEASDPDGLAGTARDEIARVEAAERAAAQRRAYVEQLQQRIRDRAAARDWDDVLTLDAELSALDPEAADPDRLASTARAQIAAARARNAARPAEQAPPTAPKPARSPAPPVPPGRRPTSRRARIESAARSQRGLRRPRVIVLSVLGVVVIAAGVLVGAWFIHRGSSPCPIPTAQYSGTKGRYQAHGVSVLGPAKWKQLADTNQLTPFQSPDKVSRFYIGTADNGRTSIRSEETTVTNEVQHGPPEGAWDRVHILHHQLCRFLDAPAFELEYTGYNPSSRNPDLKRHEIAWLWLRGQTVKQVAVNMPQYLWGSKADALFAQLVRTAKDT